MALRYSTPIGDELATTWGLTPQQRRGIDYREGCCCAACGSSVRRMNFAKAFLEHLNLTYQDSIQTMADLPNCARRQEIVLAEINNCGNLHHYFRAFPNHFYSEYGSTRADLPSEDLRALSYEEQQFDLVLTSDVLEHVPDYRQALAEIKRVLKIGGGFIFTVPWLDDRLTVTRAAISPTGTVVHQKEPSFHGDPALKMADHLVFHEFGRDFVTELADFFETTLYCHQGFGGLLSSVFRCIKR